MKNTDMDFLQNDNLLNELERLKELEKVFLNFLEITPDYIYIKDKNYKFLYVSKSFANLVGFENKEDLIGKTKSDIISTKQKEFYFNNEKEILSFGKHITNIEEPYYKNGKLCYASSSKRPMYDDKNNIIGLFCISRDITRRKEYEKKLQTLAEKDSLTGLNNRRVFFQQSRKLLELCEREKKEAVLYFIDLDGFKQINDDHCHDFGDEVLKVIAERLLNDFRLSDIICRFGGDEFLILTISSARKEIQEKVKDNIFKTISKDIKYKDITFNINCSIGTSSFPQDSKSIDNLISIADKEMYKNKKKSKNEYNI